MAIIQVTTTLQEILNAPYWNSWEDFCEKYGYNVWCINEGRANGDEQVSISMADALLYGLELKDEE